MNDAFDDLDSDEQVPAWLDTGTLLPMRVRCRVALALLQAQRLREDAETFLRLNRDLFDDYADLVTDDVPVDVWEVLDQRCGYTSLWVSVVMAQAALGNVLEVVRPAAICRDRARRPD